MLTPGFMNSVYGVGFKYILQQLKKEWLVTTQMCFK